MTESSIEQRLKSEFGYPFLSPSLSVEEIEFFVERFRGIFCVSNSFDPEFLARLMYNGFLTMADRSYSLRSDVLSPKLHEERSLVSFDSVSPPHKSTLKKAKKFTFCIDTQFSRVCEGIVKQHGQNWFYPQLILAFEKMNKKENLNGKVQVHSFEIFCEGLLVAGEVGYTVGAVYTSLSGFANMDASGTVQMMCTGKYLRNLGFQWWDFGMQMEYKEREFGAKPVPRKEFLKILRTFRDVKIKFPSKEEEDLNGTNARDFLQS